VSGLGGLSLGLSSLAAHTSKYASGQGGRPRSVFQGTRGLTCSGTVVGEEERYGTVTTTLPRLCLIST